MRAGLNRSVAGHAAHESHVELAPMARDHGVPERNFLAKYAGTVLERLAPAQHSPHDDFVPPLLAGQSGFCYHVTSAVGPVDFRV